MDSETIRPEFAAIARLQSSRLVHRRHREVGKFVVGRLFLVENLAEQLMRLVVPGRWPIRATSVPGNLVCSTA